MATETTIARKAKAKQDGTVAKQTRIAPRHRPSLTSEQRDQIQQLITEHPTATLTEIALMAGVSLTSVSRIKDRMSGDAEESTEEYGRRLGKRLPMGERVRLWSKLARGKVDPRLAFAQKAALQRVEELIGHVTAKEKRESEATQQLPGPLFVLPPGCAVMVAPVQTQPVVVVQEKAMLPEGEKPASD